MRSRRIPTLLAILLLLVGGAAACGDDGGGDDSESGSASETDGGGDVQAFCDRLTELDDEGAFADDTDDALDAFEELAEDAPEDVQDALDELRDAFADLAELDDDDPEDAEEAFDILFGEDVVAAIEAFGEFAEEECDLDDVVGGGIEDLTEDFSDDFTNDFSDDFTSDQSDFSDDFSDDGPNDASLLRDFLEAEYPDFAPAVGGIGSVDRGDGSYEFTLTMNLDADPELGNGICDAVLDYGEQEGYSGVTVEVETSDDVVIATGELGEGCGAA